MLFLKKLPKQVDRNSNQIYNGKSLKKNRKQKPKCSLYIERALSALDELSGKSKCMLVKFLNFKDNVLYKQLVRKEKKLLKKKEKSVWF